VLAYANEARAYASNVLRDHENQFCGTRTVRYDAYISRNPSRHTKPDRVCLDRVDKTIHQEI
jgi:hypothetical protein